MEVREDPSTVMLNGTVMYSKEHEDCQLNLPDMNGPGSVSDINNEENEYLTQSSKQDDVFSCLSRFYAEILLLFTGTSIILEIFHEDLPLFYIQDYIFLYLFGIGILLFIGTYAKQYCGYCNKLPDNTDDKLQDSPLKSSRQKQGFNISLFYKVGGFVFGSCVVFVTMLEVLSLFVSPKKCLRSVSFLPPILRCVFVSLQICFLKNPNEHISRFKGLRNFALMHLFATNGAALIRLFMWESAMDWEHGFHPKHNSSFNPLKKLNFTAHTLEYDLNSEDEMKLYPNHVVQYTSVCWWRVQKVEERADVLSVTYCLQNSTTGYFWGQAKHFLYPFMVQYYLVIAGILYMLWFNFNVKRRKCVFMHSVKSKNGEMCSQSTKGFFLGFIICIVTTIIVIIFFSVHKNLDMAISILYIIIFSSAFFACLIGLSQVRKLVTWNQFYDIKFINLFQKLGIYSLLIYGICGLICESISEDRNIILILSAIGLLVHGCSQYIFIYQVSRKKVDISNIHEKAGRQTIAFLILCNVALWLLDCFVNWNNMKESNELTLNKLLWPVLIRYLLPIVAFHRFHSFITLLKIWSRTYT